MKRFLALMLGLALVAAPASAQITVPNTHVAGAVIRAAHLNENFTALGDKALNRITGGSVEGNIALLTNVTIDGVDLSDFLLPSGVVLANTAGTATTPSVALATDTNTGLYFPALDQVALALGGVQRFLLNSSGLTIFGVTIIGADGKLPALTSTYVASLSFDATNLTGSLADARLSPNVPLLNAANTFSAGTVFASGLRFTGPATLQAAEANVLSFETPVTRFFIGDGSGYSFRFSKRVASTTTDVLTVTDLGLVTLTNQLTAASSATYSLAGADANGLGMAATHASGALRFYANGTTLSATLVNNLGTGTATPQFSLPARSTGSGTPGPRILIGRNSHATPAAGALGIEASTGTSYYVWPDATGVLRINTAPTGDGVLDTAGTVVGAQSSQRATKNIYGEFTDYSGALQTILDTPLYDFDYKSGSYSNQRFIGITTDDSPVFGMDGGRSFNPVTAFGYTAAAIKALEARVRALEQELLTR